MLAPAWTQLAAGDRHNAAAINDQRAADSRQGATIAPILDRIRGAGADVSTPGRRTIGAQHFTVGAVPVFKYLESQDIDEVGYTLRTASLMTDPEYYFDESNPGDYKLFGVRYILAPQGMPTAGAGHAGHGPGPVRPVGAALGRLRLRRPSRRHPHGEPGRHRSSIGGLPPLPVARGGKRPPRELRRAAVPGRPWLRAPLTDRADGAVLSEHVQLGQGSARVVGPVANAALVVLSASFDPGWTVRVDGGRRPRSWWHRLWSGSAWGRGPTGWTSSTRGSLPTSRSWC